MPLLREAHTFFVAETHLFTLAISHASLTTRMNMRMIAPILTTRDLPNTYTILERFLPSVLKSRCFNDDNRPFFEEVRQTEVGHLFEHILLEYLCQLRMAKGVADAVYSGTTQWNWYKDPRGTFHISINCGSKDRDIFPQALERSIFLLKLILKRKSPTHQKILS